MNTSYHVVELLRKKISNEHLRASDTDVARVLGVSRALISAYKGGDTVMSLDTLERAQKLLELPADELLDYSLRLSLDASPETKAIHAAHKWMMEQARRLPAILAALALPAIVASSLFFPSESRAATGSDSHEMYITSKRRRRRFWALLPMLALSGCAALSTPEEITWQSLHAVDTAQTYSVAGNPCYAEGHPMTRALIGAQPTHAGVLAWGVGGAIVHAGVSEWLLDNDHPRLFKAWEYVSIIDTGASIGQSWSVGVRIGTRPNRECVR